MLTRTAASLPAIAARHTDFACCALQDGLDEARARCEHAAERVQRTAVLHSSQSSHDPVKGHVELSSGEQRSV